MYLKNFIVAARENSVKRSVERYGMAVLTYPNSYDWDIKNLKEETPMCKYVTKRKCRKAAMQKLKMLDADTLLYQPLDKSCFVVDGLIPTGLSLFCGSQKIGKSWLMLKLCLCVSQGSPFWEMPTTRSDVLVSGGHLLPYSEQAL